jgi:hypothetical protein
VPTLRAAGTMPPLLVATIFSTLLLRAPAQTVSTLAGGGPLGDASGFSNAVGTNALFNDPYDVAIGASGDVFVADANNHQIRLIHPDSTVITFAGAATSGAINAIGTHARFNLPFGIAVSTAGAVLVADSSNNLIRLIHPNRSVTTLAGGGSAGGTSSGFANGVGSAALFAAPYGVAVDTSGAVYVADASNNRIRLIYPNRSVITLAGGSSSGSTNAIGTNALFNLPYGVAVDALGAVYVADAGNNRLRLIHLNRSVITLAGGGSAGSTNGVGTGALFDMPHGVAVDYTGTVYVADWKSHKIRILFPNRTVITLAGGNTAGFTNGFGTNALFSNPYGVAADASGAVVVADYGNRKIRLISSIHAFFCPPGTFANFTSRKCTACPPGSYSSTAMAPACSLCPGGTFSAKSGAASAGACQECNAGYFCPPGTGVQLGVACGAANYCPRGSTAPLPCPVFGMVDAIRGPANGPAFDVDTASCYSHCFSGGDGQTSFCP